MRFINYVAFIVAITIMNNASGIELFTSRGRNHLRISSITAKCIANSVGEFSKTGQNINNFDISIERKDNLIAVSFTAKRAAGERILGGHTSLGTGVTYITSTLDCSIIKEQGHR